MQHHFQAAWSLKTTREKSCLQPHVNWIHMSMSIQMSMYFWNQWDTYSHNQALRCEYFYVNRLYFSAMVSDLYSSAHCYTWTKCHLATQLILFLKTRKRYSHGKITPNGFEAVIFLSQYHIMQSLFEPVSPVLGSCPVCSCILYKLFSLPNPMICVVWCLFECLCNIYSYLLVMTLS